MLNQQGCKPCQCAIDIICCCVCLAVCYLLIGLLCVTPILPFHMHSIFVYIYRCTVSGGNLTVSAPTHHPQLSQQAISPSLPATTNITSTFTTMSDDSFSTAIPCAVYASLPVMTEENLPSASKVMPSALMLTGDADGKQDADGRC